MIVRKNTILRNEAVWIVENGITPDEFFKFMCDIYDAGAANEEPSITNRHISKAVTFNTIWRKLRGYSIFGEREKKVLVIALLEFGRYWEGKRPPAVKTFYHKEAIDPREDGVTSHQTT